MKMLRTWMLSLSGCLSRCRYVGVLLGLLLFACCVESHATPPNIIFILIDDMGMEMVKQYGATGLVMGPYIVEVLPNGSTVTNEVEAYETPHIDALIEGGMRFERAFATPSCAPTRAELLTGRYPFRTDIIFPTLPRGFMTNEVTYAKLLQDAGYATGFAGKWNLRYGIFDSNATNMERENTQTHIKKNGFDKAISFVGHTIDYGDPSVEANYAPYQINQWATNFVARQSQNSNPFYLQYALGLVHSPFPQTPLNFDKDNESSVYENYLSMIKYTDDMIGNLLATIEESGISENTLIFLAGDNGSSGRFISKFNGKAVKGGKLNIERDVGSRVPFSATWPGVINANSTYNGLMDLTDVFPTVLDLAGVSIPLDRRIDGTSFLRQLFGYDAAHRESGKIYSQYYYSWFVRNDEYRLVRNRSGTQLYSVTNSPYEDIKIANKTAEQIKIQASLQAYYDEITTESNGADDTIKLVAETITWKVIEDVVWQNADFHLKDFTNPVIIVGPLSNGATNPAVARTRNVTAEGFQFKVNPWDYIKDRTHSSDEALGLFALEQGSYIIDNLQIDALTVSGITKRSQKITYSTPFTNAPVVFCQLASSWDSTCATPRIKKVKNNEFMVRLQEQETGANQEGDRTGKKVHGEEFVHVIAISQGVSTDKKRSIEVGRKSLTHQWKTIRFKNRHPNPVFIAQVQTMSEVDPVTVRYRNLTPSSVEVRLQEEHSNAQENDTTHAKEKVGWMVITER